MLADTDRIAITELSHRYAAHADARDFDRLEALFTPDAELVMPDPPDELAPARPAHGRDAIIATLTTLRDIPVTLHGILGVTLEPADTADSATGSVAGVAHHITTRGDEHRDLVWYLHYSDRYRRVDGRWLFARRALLIDWIETHPVRRSRAAH